MAKFLTRSAQKSGAALGAIGAGSIELRPDGEFHEWQIANQERWSRVCGDRTDVDNGEKLAGSLSFYIRTKEERGTVLLRRLGLGFGSDYVQGEYNYRMHSLTKTVQEVAYEGTFPTVSVEYHDDALPVSVRLKAASPFVPYEEKTAGTPGIFLTFAVTNHSDAALDVSLAGKLRSFVNAGEDAHNSKTYMLQEDGCSVLVMESAEGADPKAADWGSVALSMEGENRSWLAGEYRGYMNEYVANGSLGISEESFLFGLRREGALPDLVTEKRPDYREQKARIEELSEEEAEELLQKLLGFGFAESIRERVETAEPKLFESAAGRRTFLEYLLHNWENLDRKFAWGDGALCSQLHLEPGETKEVRFVLSWYFPALYSQNQNFTGHMYANWFTDAADVNAWLRRERERILESVTQLADTLYQSGLPEDFADAVSTNLSTIVKCSWWAKDGNFGIWEGLGSCGFHTTDVTYYGSFGLVTLFPKLQKRQMRMGARFQRKDGRVHHFFTPDFESVDDGFDRVDMNPQFVLLVCRDYLATGDLEYVRGLWPNLVSAMDSIQRLDGNGDGLPDQDTGRNTYDAWNFSGTSAFISLLWLAAARAMSRMAQALGETKQKERFEQLLEKGTAAVEELLWNGQYYNLWIDGEKKDVCCMTDQLEGEYFSRLIGLGGILREDRVNRTLDSIWRYNYSRENGLINAGYPEGAPVTLYTYRNCQGQANWSGIEYAMAAFYLMQGDEERAEQLVANVQERHLRAGEFWNHAECGDHYYRPLSSWALIQAYGGVTWDLAQRTVKLAWREGQKVVSPWFCATGYGQLQKDEQGASLTVKYGEVTLEAVGIDGCTRIQCVTVNGQKIAAQGSAEAGNTILRFAPVTLRAEDVLRVE